MKQKKKNITYGVLLPVFHTIAKATITSCMYFVLTSVNFSFQFNSQFDFKCRLADVTLLFITLNDFSSFLLYFLLAASFPIPLLHNEERYVNNECQNFVVLRC